MEGKRGPGRPRKPVDTNKPVNPRKGVKRPDMLHNVYFRNAINYGNKQITCADLAKGTYEYMEWCEKNPIQVMKAFSTGLVINEPRPRAMNIYGLAGYMGCLDTSLYENAQTDPMFKKYLDHARMLFNDYKYTHSAAGNLKSDIVMREMNMVDRSSIELKSTEFKVKFGSD